jgi:site-specific DNA-methyltransferase (adenine-specific)
MIRNRLIKGDNVEVLKEMESGVVDLTVTSPPYDNLRDYKGVAENL